MPSPAAVRPATRTPARRGPVPSPVGRGRAVCPPAERPSASALAARLRAGVTAVAAAHDAARAGDARTFDAAVAALARELGDVGRLAAHHAVGAPGPEQVEAERQRVGREALRARVRASGLSAAAYSRDVLLRASRTVQAWLQTPPQNPISEAILLRHLGLPSVSVAAAILAGRLEAVEVREAGRGAARGAGA